MVDTSGYIIKEKIYEDDKTRVFKGRTVKDQKPVILRVLKIESSTPVDVSNFIYGYEIPLNLDFEGIIRPVRLINTEDALAIEYSDNKEIIMREFFINNPLDISVFFEVAIQLAQVLGKLHQRGIIHCSLKPENILIHPETGKVKIFDFSHAFNFHTKNKDTAVGRVGSGNMGYMSPEQLGLVEEDVDYRSDYYSLGVMFYEMITGQLPHKAVNLEELIWAHIAREPESPYKINPKIPPVLSAVIMKLLSKAADERYYSAYGIIRDLEECRQQWNITRKIEPFTLGRMDIPLRIELPHELIGREDETKALRASFERTCAGQGELVLVSGYAGTGKTMLVKETIMPVSIEKGYYAYGKLDQLRINTPYAPFVGALGSVVKQIMTESSERLEIWKKRILNALGNNGAVITGLIPELEMIIGQQPPVEVLRPKEAQNRLFMLFENFIKVFARKEHPLAIFLDDLQWVDIATLELIKYLCISADMEYMMVIGTYRDNEINEKHPLITFLQELKEEQIKIHEIYLYPLNKKDVIEFVIETLHCPESNKLDMLADMLYRKTCGNPFFLGQILESVCDNGLVKFNAFKGCWEWEIETIQNLQMQDDVVDLIHLNLKKLPKKTLDVLKLASCIGRTFEMEILSIVYEKPKDEIYSFLLPAIQEGLIIPICDSFKIMHTINNHITSENYDFLHDKVWQSVYSLLSEDEKKEKHVKVGRLIMKSINKDVPDDRILPVLDHLNRGIDLIYDPNERLRLARYNFEAGLKAKVSAAYDSMRSCFKSGIKFLPRNAWNCCYRLCYDLHIEYAQCEYIMGNVDKAEKLFNIIIRYTKTEYERINVYAMKMVLYAGTRKYTEAVRIGIDLLKKLGMKMPESPSPYDIGKELLLYKWHMFSKKPEDLLKLPEMKDLKKKRIAEHFVKFILAVCSEFPDLYSYTIMKTGNYTIKFGKSEMSSIGFIGYSIAEGSMFGNYTTGFELCKIAMELAEKYDNSFSKCIIYFTIGALIYHWTHHIKEGFEYLQKAIEYAFQSGNILIAGYSYGVILENKYLMGMSFEVIMKEIQSCSNYAKKVKHENLALNTEIYKRIITILSSQTEEISSKDIHILNEEDFLKSVKEEKTSLATYYLIKMQFLYLAGKYMDALSVAEKIKKYMAAILGFMTSAESVFYHSLIITAVYLEAPLKQRKKLIKTLKENQKQMKKWADYCNENFMHKYLIVEAEVSRILGEKHEAGILYDKAILSARENGFIQNEAIVCELAAKFYESEGRIKLAKEYMKDALNLYRNWGAFAKEADLKLKHPKLMNEVITETVNENYNPADLIKKVFRYSNINTNGNGMAVTTNMSTIQKAIKSISEQPEFNKMAECLLDIAMDSICANKGCLILEKDNELFIEAVKIRENNGEPIIKSISLEKSYNISKYVVRYVARTLEPIIVNNDADVGIFTKDPYISQSGVKSIVCVPILLRGILVGVLYFESSFMTGVFTKERIEMLNLLADQMVYAKALQDFLNLNVSQTKYVANLPMIDQLTKREREVLELIASGLSNREVANRLESSVNTVKTHVKNIYEKLQVSRRVQAVEKARKLNIL